MRIQAAAESSPCGMLVNHDDANTSRGARICGRERTYSQAILDVWQLKELCPNSTEMWQGKGLEDEKQELEEGAITGRTGRGPSHLTRPHYRNVR